MRSIPILNPPASVEGRVRRHHGPDITDDADRHRSVCGADRPDDAPRPWHARMRGFDLHAAVGVRAGARDRLERMCRYALRPAVGQERLHVSPEGQVVLDLRRRWADGTTQLVFDPVEFLERLAALVPRPRINLVLYYGVLAPRAAWRDAVVPSPTTGATGAPGAANACGFDVLACPRCAGRMILVALIRDAAVVGRILRHLGLPDAVRASRAGRAPPLPWETDAEPEWSGVG